MWVSFIPEDPDFWFSNIVYFFVVFAKLFVLCSKPTVHGAVQLASMMGKKGDGQAKPQWCCNPLCQITVPRVGNRAQPHRRSCWSLHSRVNFLFYFMLSCICEKHRAVITVGNSGSQRPWVHLPNAANTTLGWQPIHPSVRRFVHYLCLAPARTLWAQAVCLWAALAGLD